MSICGSVRRWETEPLGRCKPTNWPANTSLNRVISFWTNSTFTEPRRLAGRRVAIPEAAVRLSAAAIFSERMYGATRRACSGYGRGRSLVMLLAALLLSVIGLLSGLPGVTEAKECDKPCMNGQCNAATGNCVCFPGWVGDQCQHCGGRFRYGERTTDTITLLSPGWGLVVPVCLCFAGCQTVCQIQSPTFPSPTRCCTPEAVKYLSASTAARAATRTRFFWSHGCTDTRGSGRIKLIDFIIFSGLNGAFHMQESHRCKSYDE